MKIDRELPPDPAFDRPDEVRAGEAGWGILLYLRQEGRGIGLVNKLRAYALQDQGFDTADANLRLGFQDDERDFSVAARMLDKLGQNRVRLLSNNPRKAVALERLGIAVAERVPLKVGEGDHNRAYLATKRDRSGHQALGGTSRHRPQRVEPVQRSTESAQMFPGQG